MEIEQALHQRWHDSTTLDGLLSAARVTTGRSSLESLPRATLGRRGKRTVGRTNAGEVLEEVTIEMRLRHESFDDGATIVRAFRDEFDRCRFALSGGAKVLHLRHVEDDCRQLDNGTWLFRVEMVARVFLPG